MRHPSHSKPVLYESRDYQDPPGVQNDQDREAFYVQYGSTSERGVFNAGGGAFLSLAEAMAGAKLVPGIGPSVRWRIG